MSRSTFFREALQRANVRLTDLELLMDRLRHGSDQESTLLLAALRLGVGYEELLDTIRAEDPFAALQDATRNLSTSSRASEEKSPGPSMSTIDSDAWEHAEIKVQAQPWTDVAGNGLVSELVSSFFEWDNTFFYPFIDRESFLQGMRTGNPGETEDSSPCLVNAICALRCVSVTDTGPRPKVQRLTHPANVRKSQGHGYFIRLRHGAALLRQSRAVLIWRAWQAVTAICAGSTDLIHVFLRHGHGSSGIHEAISCL